MNTCTTKTNQKHSPFRAGARSAAIGFCGDEQLFVEQRANVNYYTPYKFSGKEIDEETSYSYFGARYYMSDVSIWLSVDPMKDKYPYQSPYTYCGWNPLMIIDPDGTSEESPTDYYNLNGNLTTVNDGKTDVKIVLTTSNKESTILNTIDKGEVVDMPFKQNINTFDEMYKTTEQNNAECIVSGGDNGQTSKIVSGVDSHIGNAEVSESRKDLALKGTLTTWDAHTHNNKLDNNGNIIKASAPIASPADKSSPNRFGIILGYGEKMNPTSNQSFGAKIETTKQIGFYNSNGQIGNVNGYSYNKFSNVVREHGK